MTAITAPLGIAPSPILAPTIDQLGQLRVDDPAVSPPIGLGQNVFKDRGAIDRADSIGPSAALVNPVATNPNTPNSAQVNGQSITQFSIQFSDASGGSGIDDS